MCRSILHHCIALFVAGAGWTASVAATPTPFAPNPTQLLLFKGATLIDGRGGPAQANMDVLIRAERIEKVIADTDLDPEIARGARIIDVRGKYLMPGMIDAHVHLATPPNRRQAEAVLRRDIYGGVTAVRDMADDVRPVGDLSRASLVGEIAAPDIYFAALMAGPDFFADERSVQASVGGTPGHVPWMQAITPQTDLPLAVAEARGTFATAIKLYAALSPELAKAIATEAHRQHMLVWAHATLYPAKPSDVVAAGVDAISHACLLVREPDAHVPALNEPRSPPNLAAVSNGDNPALAKLFAEMHRRGTILDATLWTYSSDTAGSTTLPPLSPGSCDDRIGGAITRQAFRAGVAIDAGTDFVAEWSDPWPDLFHEMSALAQKAGLPNMAVLQAATLVGARALGQEQQMGSVEAGKMANLVIFSRDPLSDLNNLKSALMTVKRGRIFERSAFLPLQKDDITDR